MSYFLVFVHSQKIVLLRVTVCWSRVHVCVCLWMGACVHAYMRACVHAGACAFVFACVRAYVRVCSFVCTCVHVCICACPCVCVHVCAVLITDQHNVFMCRWLI